MQRLKMVGDSQTLNLFKSFNTASGMSIVATGRDIIDSVVMAGGFNTASGMSIVATLNVGSAHSTASAVSIPQAV